MKSLEAVTKKVKDVEKPAPVNHESPFNFNELFFSITDQKSNILFANETFVRISKYEQKEIIGQLHKLIRHPDMPRSVFNIFWEYLLADKPVAAYVKNMAKDGSYYWVMALAFPCKGGYLSIRLKPGSLLFDKVKEFYASVLQVENQTAGQSDKKSAMMAGQAHLIYLLKKEGYADYEEFMWSALQMEMANREKQLLNISSSTSRKDDIVPGELIELEEILGNLVSSLEELVKIHKSLSSHSDYILQLARSILLLSLNAQVGSAKLDSDDLSLSVVAEKMGEQSVSGERELVAMKNIIHKLNDLIGCLNFDIISSKLQVEMTIAFLKELSQNSYQEEDSLLSSDEATTFLKDAFKPRLAEIQEGLGLVPVYLKDLLSGVKAIERFLMVLRFIHITGKVEVARMDNANNAFATTFQELISEVDVAESHLKELSNVVTENTETVKMYEKYKEKINLLAIKAKA